MRGSTTSTFTCIGRIRSHQGRSHQRPGAVGGTEESEEFTIDPGPGRTTTLPRCVCDSHLYPGHLQLLPDPSCAEHAANRDQPSCFPSFRASHDIFTSHSEPNIAMNPLNHANLVAGSKQVRQQQALPLPDRHVQLIRWRTDMEDLQHLPVPDCSTRPPPLLVTHP